MHEENQKGRMSGDPTRSASPKKKRRVMLKRASTIGGKDQGPTDPAAADVTGLDANTKGKWVAVLKHFPDLNQYDYKNLLNHEAMSKEQTEKVRDFFEAAINYCKDHVSVMVQKTIQEDALKILSIALKTTYTRLLELVGVLSSPDTDSSTMLIHDALLTNSFMAMLIEETNSPIREYSSTLVQCLDLIAMSILDALLAAQLTSPPKQQTGALILYCVLDCLAIMAALNENQLFMKTAAVENLKKIYTRLLQMLKVSTLSPSIQQIYGVSFDCPEDWALQFFAPSSFHDDQCKCEVVIVILPCEFHIEMLREVIGKFR